MLSARDRSLEITRSGWLFLGFTLLVGFAAVNSGANLLHALFGTQMALILGSGILSERTVRRVAIDRTPMGAVYAGTPSAIAIRIHNRDRRAPVFSISVEDDEFGGPGSCTPVFAVHVESGQSTFLRSSVTLPARGRHPLPAAVVATRFPFGLFVKRRRLAVGEPLLVYPRVDLAGAPEGPSRPQAEHDVADRDRLMARGVDGDFFGLRPYRDHDDARRIHWPAFARTGHPFVREQTQPSQTRTILELAEGRTGERSFEREVERVASAVHRELQQPDHLVGLRYGDELVIAPTSGTRGYTRLMAFLAEVGRC
jgi:uncharacterized protein (DUF58 family)